MQYQDMWRNINFAQCSSFINSVAAAEAYADSRATFVPDPDSPSVSPPVFGRDKLDPKARPSITISRMCGSGGRSVASILVDYLQAHSPAGKRWTVFDKNLIEKVLEDQHLSKRLAELLPEDRRPRLAAMMKKMRGLESPATLLVKRAVETIWNLAVGGYVILVGRAANVITAQLDNVFHVRLVGSPEARLARVEDVYELSRRDAREFIKLQDSAKRLYMRDYFGRKIDDPMLYHMIVNTDLISYEHAARLIGDAVINRFKEPARAGPVKG